MQRLRPGPRRALIIADFHVGIDEAVNETVPELNEILEATIAPPVRATQTGYATLSRAIQDDSIAATERGELIALPILLIVLLLVFRSPIAAAIPLAFGAVTVIASRGLLSILTDWFSIDAFALTVCTMMGLALGVDYALLMVSRFREELAAGADAARRRPRRPAAPPAAPPSSPAAPCCSRCWSRSSSSPARCSPRWRRRWLIVVVLSVLVAIVAGPAVLILLGPNVDRWRIGPGARRGPLAADDAGRRRAAPPGAGGDRDRRRRAGPGRAGDRAEDRPAEPTQLAHDDPARRGRRTDRATRSAPASKRRS